MTSKSSLLSTVGQTVDKDRAKQYGDFRQNYDDAAKIASVLLRKKLKVDLDRTDVLKVLQAVKLARETEKHKRDNFVDLVGYTYLLDEHYERK